MLVSAKAGHHGFLMYKPNGAQMTLADH